VKALIGALIALTWWTGSAQAQHQHGSGYASMMARPIKALSDDQVTQLKEGRGMGLSLPAELNSHPGPMHALELADVLNLTSEQRTRLTAIRQDMSAKAIALGHQVIAAEARLDGAFAAGKADQADIANQLAEIGRLNGELRAVHILAHMETRMLLTASQVSQYDVERGYSVDGGAHRHESRVRQ
jgi:Spy/CpxP family protein refolding chaperone